MQNYLSILIFNRTTVSIAVFLTLIILPNISNIAFANQAITILPGASDSRGQVLFDTTFYSLKRGTQLIWINNDDIGHRIIVTTAENGTQLLHSGFIKPKNSFSYRVQCSSVAPALSAI